MSLGDAYVEGTVGHGLHQLVHGAARGHGGGDAHNARIHSCQLHQSLAEYVLVLWRFVSFVVAEPFSCLRVELSRCVPYSGGFLGRFISLAFYGVYVQQFRAFHVFQVSQYAYQFLDIVPVNGAEVAYVHALKYVLL